MKSDSILGEFINAKGIRQWRGICLPFTVNALGNACSVPCPQALLPALCRTGIFTYELSQLLDKIRKKVLVCVLFCWWWLLFIRLAGGFS